MNTLRALEMRYLLDDIAKIEELTNLLRHKHFDVPFRTVYDAVGAVGNIRDRLLRVALADVAVEPVTTLAMCAAVMP